MDCHGIDFRGRRQSLAGAEGYLKVSGLSDESLLAGLRSGEPDHTAAFVRRFQSRVYGLAMKVVGDTNVAEDVAQETFVRAWRYAGAYDARRGPVATWLLTIARNVATDARRLRGWECRDPAELAALGVPSPDAGPEETALALGEAEELRRAIAELPEGQRRALVLAAFQGCTAREIGEAEGIALGTAKTRIRAAMMKLRSALEGRR
ncbi:MAG TPA: sigma-70 family RNA polymerase sigma factor [Actinomycetota bacterium]|nr:sigma-70 family RNA polymerase sigma factor [Actinomycetota bacterium]